MCKMFMAAGPFDQLEGPSKIKLHGLLTELYRASNYDRTDQDAMGVFAWRANDLVKYHSRPAGSAARFLAEDPVWKLLADSPANLYLCHQRGAMSPVHPDANNHPFVSDHHALMHVGWISCHRDIADIKHLELVSDTDTELYLRLADAYKLEEGDKPDEIMENMISLTHEPTALAMVDIGNRNPAIWFGRNQYSLHNFYIYEVPELKAKLIVATEAMMIIAGEYVDVDYHKVDTVTPGHVYKMAWDANKVIQVR